MLGCLGTRVAKALKLYVYHVMISDITTSDLIFVADLERDLVNFRAVLFTLLETQT